MNNSVGHFLGYHKYDIPDASRNIFPWGIINCGDESHNNHQTYANSAQFSSRWLKIDMGWFYVRLLVTINLLEIQRRIPEITYDNNKIQCDFNTGRVIVNYRFQVLSSYARDVVKGVCSEELRRSSGEYRKLIK